MKQALSTSVAGRYKMSAVKEDGSRRDLTDWFDNLVLDTGLERLATGATLTYCRVGTDNTAPANAQTTLGAQVSEGTVYSQSSGYDNVDHLYAYRRVVYRFPRGSTVAPLKEVGVGWATGLFSRALIVDQNGNPTTVSPLIDEILEVTYELRMYRPAADVVSNVVVSGVNYTCTVRADLMATLWDDALIALTDSNAASSAPACYGFDSMAALAPVSAGSMGTGNFGPISAVQNGAYVANSHEYNWRLTVGLPDCTSAIGGMRFSTVLGDYQMLISPAIPKDADTKLIFDFKTAWARH